MERLYRWNTPEQQSSLLAVIRKGSPGFVLFPEGKVDQSILSHFGAIVAQYPNRLAVKGRHSAYTYSELDLASNAIAAAVRTENDGRNPNVAVFIEQDAQMIACILGILKAGSIYVPLDPSLTGTRNSVILDDSLAKTVFTDSANRERAKALFGSNCRIFDVDEVISRGGEAPLSSIAPEDLACIIYTSGSTGRPRGVLHTHRTVVQMAKRYANAKAVSVNDRVSLFYSCSVAASLGNIFGPLLSGAALLSFNVRALGFSALANWLKEEKISVYHSSPSVFRATFESMPADEILPHARIVRIGGDMAYKSDFDLFKHRVKPGSAMVNAYGCSEMSTLFCFYMTPESVITEPILPVGCPVDDTEIAVLDEHGEIA